MLMLLLPFSGMAQLFNGDFEDLNDTLAIGWAPYEFGAGLKTDYAHSGSYSMAVWNWYSYAEGYATNGESMATLWTDMPSVGTPTTEKALLLTGYYYYDTTNTTSDADTAVIAIAYRKWNTVTNLYDTVAFGRKYLLPTSGSDMVPFSVAIEDWAPGVEPDTFIVLMVSSLHGFCDMANGGNCLYLYVDDLKLEKTTGIATLNNFEPLGLYPNPTAHTITIKVAHEGITWRLYNLSGKTVYNTALHQGENRVDISSQPAGLYIAELWRNGTVTHREKLIKQ